MSQFQTGPSPIGVYGWIGAPGQDAITETTPGFQGTFYAYEVAQKGQLKARYGPTTGGDAIYRYVTKDVSLAISGIEVPFTPTEPANWEGQKKQVVIRHGVNPVIFQTRKTAGDIDKDAYTAAAYDETFTVVVESFKKSRDTQSKTPGHFLVDITCRVEGDPTYSAAWGLLPIGGDVERSDQVTYDNTFISADPQGINGQGQIAVDFWGPAIAGPVALQQRLLQLITSTVIPPGHKKVSANIRQDSPNGGLFTIQTGLVDSKDAIENQSTTSADPVGLFDTATRYVVQDNAAYAPPPAPVGHIIGFSIHKLNDGKWQAVYEYGSLDNKQRIEFLESIIENDQSDLNDRDAQVITNGSPNPPPTPTPRIDNLQLIQIITVRIGGLPVVWKHVFRFARNTAIQEMEFAGTRTFTATGNVGDSAVIRKITASLAAPSVATPVGQPIGYAVRQIVYANGTFSGFWEHEFTFGNTTNLQRIQFQGQRGVDLSALNDEEEITVTVASSAVPSAPIQANSSLQLRRYWGRRVEGTPELWEWHFFFARNTYADDITLAGTNKRLDPDHFMETGQIRILNDSEDPGTAPAVPSGLTSAQHINTEVQQVKVQNGTFDGLWVITFFYGPNKRKQQLQYDRSIGVVDRFGNSGNRTATVEAWTGTPQAKAEAVRLANLLNKNFAGADVITLNGTQVLQIIRETALDFGVSKQPGRTIRRSFRGIPPSAVNAKKIALTDFGFGEARVKFQVYGQGAGGNGFRLAVPTTLDCSISYFTLRRVLSYALPGQGYHLDLVGKVNNAFFMDYPPYNVRYNEPSIQFTIEFVGARYYVYDYPFETDSSLFVDDANILIGDNGSNSSPTLATSGFYVPTVLDASALLKWPETADFSVFRAP